MEVRTYRASTMYEALRLVRRELGPDAAVLHTREIRARRLFGWMSGPAQIEVTAALDVNVPSRLPPRRHGSAAEALRQGPPPGPATTAAAGRPPCPRADLPESVQCQLTQLQAMLKDLSERSFRGQQHDLPEELFRLFTELLDCEVPEELARQLVERVRADVPDVELADPLLVKARIVSMIEEGIRVAGPIAVAPGGRRLVALVGPTGVGKTTTIAKLAANYRLKEKRRVGLITVDTYRIAAVEQLRTYADIIDLPMQVVSTPREMREAVAQMANLELILMDTAGRSPKDEVRIQELKTFLGEAAADEVHLVLSSVAGSTAMEQTARRFADVGTTALVLTKLDEAASLGNVLPVLRSSRLPLSYVTNGQNVPDDIEIANAHRLARVVLGLDPAAER